MSDLTALIREFKTGYSLHPEAYTLAALTTGNDVVRLRPLPGLADQISSQDVELLTEWRNRHRRAFLSEFQATPERTRRWLTDVYGSDSSRILFMVETADGLPFGNAGICHISGERLSAEIDNIVRGADVAPGGMGAAVSALCEWIRSLGVTHISVRVMADNPAAAFYERLGFRTVKDVALVRRQVGPAEFRWEERPHPHRKPERSLRYMELAA